jgi:hypothetical protein
MASNNKEYYLGNANLKKTRVRIEYTPEQILEFQRCAEDPIYFIKKYVKIVNVDLGVINFDLWAFQEQLVKKAIQERFVICKMPRQVGKTTTVAALILHNVLFAENFSVAILANKEKQAREILSRIQMAYENLPKWLQQGIVEWNKGNIELENGSKILASATSASAIRGTSQNLIYLDEFAFVPSNMQEEFFASVYPTISSGKTTKVLITSTPNGLNMFYKLWVDSEQGNNSYTRVDVHWSDVPGRDEEWKKETIRNTSEEQFRQEYECEFLGSSNTLLSPSTLKRLVFRHPVKMSPEGLKVYYEPLQEGLYCIVVDTSRGKGLDYSAFVVFDCTEFPYKAVATFKNNEISPLIYPTIIEQTGRYYNNAFILIETNDIGQQVADIVYQDLEYENVVFCETIGKGGQVVSSGFSNSKYVGVRTTKQVKRIGCGNIKSLIEEDKLIICDYDTIQEFSRFSLKRTSYEAEEGNDDLVMCHVLFGWLSSQPFFKELTNNDIRKKLFFEKQKMIEEQMLPFPIVEDGHQDQSEFEIVDLENQSFDQWMRN